MSIFPYTEQVLSSPVNVIVQYFEKQKSYFKQALWDSDAESAALSVRFQTGKIMSS